MNVTIAINIEMARKVLTLSSGSVEEADGYAKMTDVEIKDTIMRRIKCWAIKEVKEPEMPDKNQTGGA